MRVILDTSAFLWFASGSQRLSTVAASVLEADEAELCLSVASAWEIAIKHSLSKLGLTSSLEELLGPTFDQLDISWLPIEIPHVIRCGTLPFHHRDPFDRLLVAQALALDVPLVTADPQLATYDVEIIAPN